MQLILGTICVDKDAIPIYESYFSETDVKFNLIPDESGFRRKVRKNRVLLADKFNKQERNNDYIEIDDEPFSEDHCIIQKMDMWDLRIIL